MNRNEIILKLEKATPLLLGVTFSEDMGYEFSAIVPEGVIYPQPGMLLAYSDGRWPPDSWKNLTAQKQKQKLNKFLMDEIWSVTPWKKLSLNELKKCLACLEDM